MVFIGGINCVYRKHLRSLLVWIHFFKFFQCLLILLSIHKVLPLLPLIVLGETSSSGMLSWVVKCLQ
jgi:hypothetical protein